MNLDLSRSIWLLAPAIGLIWIGVWWIVKGVAFRALKRIAERTRWKLDGLPLASLEGPFQLLILASGLLLASRFLPLSPAVDEAAALGFKAILIVAMIAFLNRFAVDFLSLYSGVEFVRTAGGVLRGLIRGFIIGIGALILLDTFGISITPILASLGIGSLAVALALQDTFANFFSGLYIVADHPIRIGDFVRLEGGQEGYVTQIGWRSTRIRMLPNSVVIVPNGKIINSTLVNYDQPDKEMAVLVEVGVHYGSDLEQVERVTVEVARHILKTVSGGVPSFEPFIRFHTFSESSIDFTVILRAREFVDQYLVRHEFIKALQKRYRQEGIVIPFPIRTLDLPRQLEKVLERASASST
ncbi:MAG: mechanosensitive ion channel family protein [Candidatus Omnitrophica bacterium]|nr:mechanosensitive ion channel family protein [Candidatus Omnitrophota bacterium]